MFASYKESASTVTLRDPRCTSPSWSYYRSEVAAPLQTVSDARLNSRSTTIASPADVRRTDLHHENTPLISRASSSSRPHSRLLESSPQLPHYPPPTTTLFPNQYNQPTQRRQNVPPFSVNASSRDHLGLPTIQHGSHRSSNLGSVPLSSFSPSQNGSISSSNHRLWTSHPVFHTTSDLAAHHGIPQFLPPVPRTTRYSSETCSSSRSESIPASRSNTDLDFSTLCSNYLTMLSKTPEERESAAIGAYASEASDSGVAIQALMEVLQTSPEFHMANDFNEYLTSPMDDSPWDEFLTTPALDSADMGSDLLSSPAIVDADDSNDFGGASLFGGSLGLTGAARDPPKALAEASLGTLPTPSFNFDGMYTMPSPTTPALDPISLHPSPHVASVAPPSSVSRRRNAPTGTRKNITPEALVPLDAPIQPRKYVTPSATSRKEVPAVFAKKRSRSQAFGLDESLDGSELPQSDLDAIEAKRRQNTIAARRSRMRKLEYQRELELSVDQERTQKEFWQHRAATLEALLRSHGIESPVP